MTEPIIQTVLVADDDKDIRTIVVETVRALGFRTIEAADGLEAINKAQPGKIDLAILDISMPGHTGIEVCTQLKQKSEGEFIPVILLTARDTVNDKVLGLESGADEYLTKPFHCQELQARIKACMRTRALNLRLREQSLELKRLQDALILKERKTVAGQIGGAAAHALGQPLSTIILNLFLLEELQKNDPRFIEALTLMKSEASKMKTMLEQIRSADVTSQEKYFGDTAILKLTSEKK